MAKSVIALAVFLLVFVEKSVACDACGCSVNGVGVGLMATYRQNFVGFQYQYAPFSSTLEHSQGAKDYFHNFELALRFRVKRRFYLQLNQPYRLNVRRQPGANAERNGLGDTRLVTTFAFLNQIPIGKKLKLYAEAGGGIKAPIGQFDPKIHEGHDLPENFNPGNGSWAGQLQANFVLNHKNSGLNISTNYLHNRPSSSEYRFGHQWSGQALLFNQFLVNEKTSLTPFFGIAAEKVGRDVKADGKFATSTGGKGFFAAAGFNMRFNDWLLGATFSQPFSQHFSNAEVEAKGRMTLQLTHIF